MIINRDAGKTIMTRLRRFVGFGILALGIAGPFFARPAVAAEELNVYSARHYDGDDALYAAFTQATGIKVNRVEAKAEELLERLQAEGKLSPADIYITVDAGNLWRAEQAGLLAPVKSDVINKAIPANLRHPEGLWTGFSVRYRILVTAKDRVKPGTITRYEDLAKPELKGKVCIRSSTNVYNQSLLGSLIATHGEDKAKAWVAGLVANLARAPQGGDTDQIKAVAAGECDVAVTNHYYLARLLTSANPADKAVAEKVVAVIPNQTDRGAHANIAGAAVLKNAPHKASAIKFMEFLAGETAQKNFAGLNFEVPANAAVATDPALAFLGKPKADPAGPAVFGANNPKALMISDQAGWR